MSKIKQKKGFTRNTNVGRVPTELYVWYPDTELAQYKVGKGGKPSPKCNAKKGSQGYDNITGYVYQLIVVNGIQENLAYVECDYVK